ncbi:MAG: hypothetical protein WBP47_25965, partial [Candidatus Promineifilaceae bacterium]
LWQGQVLKILAAHPSVHDLAGASGQIFPSKDGQTAVVATGSGSLHLQTVQLSGKRALDAAEFLRGRPDFIGSRLED